MMNREKKKKRKKNCGNLKLGEKKKLHLWQFSCQNMKGTLKKGPWKFGNIVAAIQKIWREERKLGKNWL